MLFRWEGAVILGITPNLKNHEMLLRINHPQLSPGNKMLPEVMHISYMVGEEPSSTPR
jgi:hypothetical protein